MKGSKNAKFFVFGQNYIDLRESMNTLIKRFYNINHVTLSIIGLWPYQNRKTRLIRTFLVQTTILFIFASHITKLVTMDLDLNMFLEIFPVTLMITATFIFYYCALAKIREVKIIWDHIRYDWNEPMNTQEINILERYALTGKSYNNFLLVGCHVIQAFVILQMIAPIALDIILPLNESRPLKPPPVMEIYIDQKKHIFLTVVILCFASLCVGIIGTAMYGSFIIVVQHACGMFRLVWYTLDKAFEKTNQRSYTVEENERIYGNIVRSIKLHRRVIEFMEVVNVFIERAWMIQILFAFFVNGINIFRLFGIKGFKDELCKMIICLLNIITILTICYINIHISQSVIDHSMAVFDQSYMTPWYMLCPKTQRLLVMLMISSLKPYYISVGNMFISCNEFYATVNKEFSLKKLLMPSEVTAFFFKYLQTTLSYTMIIYSLQ